MIILFMLDLKYTELEYTKIYKVLRNHIKDVLQSHLA